MGRYIPTMGATHRSGIGIWIKALKGRNLNWQDGYGAFSVNPAEVDKVITYIDNQHEHHRKRTF